MRVLCGALSVAALFSLVPCSAEACSCGESARSAYPQGSELVPRDIRIWLPGDTAQWETSPFLMQEASGQEVPFESQRLVDLAGRAFYTMLIPNALLEPGAYSMSYPEESFQLNTSQPGPWDGFVVGDFLSTTPAVPAIRSSDDKVTGAFGGTSSCGDDRFTKFEVEVLGAFLLTNVNGLAALPEPPEDWVAIDLTDTHDVSGTQTFRLGHAPCESNWDFEEEGGAAVRFKALNLSGKSSEWSSQKVVNPGMGCGCEVGRSGSRGLLAWLGISLACALTLARRGSAGSVTQSQRPR